MTEENSVWSLPSPFDPLLELCQASARRTRGGNTQAGDSEINNAPPKKSQTLPSESVGG